MADNTEEFIVRLSIEDSTDFFPEREVSFILHDSIFNMFPSIEVIYADTTGLALEWGTFIQGVKLSVSLGEQENYLESIFRSLNREVIKSAGSAPLLSGVIRVCGLHKSYFDDRSNPKKSFFKKTVSDCVKDLFSSEEEPDIEDTKGKINTYAYEDPYSFTKEVLLKAAYSGKIDPYVFFRDLKEQLHFCSLDHLMEQSSVATLELKSVLSEQDDERLIISGFLPFNEDGQKVYPFMRTEGKFLNSDLVFKQEENSVAKDAQDTIPFISENKIGHAVYFGREFNPCVDYGDLNKGFASSSMKFILDKAICIVPFNADYVAGKILELKVSIINTEGSEELSQFYSGVWLIEQSFHSWSGEEQKAMSKLVLCRKSVKPIKDSALGSKAFKN